MLGDWTCCHGYSYDSVKLHKIPSNVFTHKRFTRSSKIWKIVKHRKQTKPTIVIEFVFPSNCGVCKNEEELQCMFIAMEDHEFVELPLTTH